MRNLIFIISLCFSAVCFGQVDGRGVICEREDTDGSTIFETYLFESNLVTNKKFSRSNDSYSIREERDIDTFQTTSSEIFWFEKKFIYIPPDQLLKYAEVKHTLSRKTGELVFTASEYPSYINRFTCRVFADIDSYNSEMNRIRDSLQEEYDKEREGNLL